MANLPKRLTVVTAMLALSLPSSARRFYPDDPLEREPAPASVSKAKRRNLNEYYDFFLNTFADPGQPHPGTGPPIPARGVNTLGEVLDSGWFQNRHGRRALSREELIRGPGVSHVPDMNSAWSVIGGKNEGITPGLTIQDARGNRFLLKFDPLSNPGMASAADVVGSKIFHALGYNVPENYIVQFTRGQLNVSPKARIHDSRGRERPMTERDISDVLRKVPRDPEGRYRGLASYFISGDLIGPFRFHGVRRDDANDTVPHEHRRDLRGLYVFAAWVNHSDSKSLNTLDSVVEEPGLRYIRHYLIDFGACLGSDSFEAKSPRAGNVYLFDPRPAALQFFTLGLYVPGWAMARYPDLPSVGRFESDTFDPERWKSNYPNPAFENALPGDHYWAAKQVMRFSDEDIAALVSAGAYSNPEAAGYVTRTLIARRDKIGRTFFSRVLPLDSFRVSAGRLEFDDLGVKYNFAQPRQYQVQWALFDNASEAGKPLSGETTFSVPQVSGDAYLAADIRPPAPGPYLTVYLRRKSDTLEVVGIDRRW